MEFVSGIKTPEEVRIQSPHIESCIADYVTSMLRIKHKISAVRMAVMTKSLEFVRVIYVGPGSDMCLHHHVRLPSMRLGTTV